MIMIGRRPHRHAWVKNSHAMLFSVCIDFFICPSDYIGVGQVESSLEWGGVGEVDLLERRSAGGGCSRIGGICRR